VPKNRPVLLLLEECGGTYAVLARWKRDPRGFVWNIPGAQENGPWHEKCGLAWAPVKIPRVPKKSKLERERQKERT
jgi:hypothetical protein